MRYLLLAAVGPAVLLAGVAGAQQLRGYSSPDGSWSVAYPPTWEVIAQREGVSAAFLAPPVRIGKAVFRPSVVVSASALDGSVSPQQVVEVARTALERAMPGAVSLGQETVTARDGRPVQLSYHYVRPGPAPAGMYVVLGIAVRSKLYTMIGTTSTALQDYRQQAALIRSIMASLAAR